jgi:superkiller protein 3
MRNPTVIGIIALLFIMVAFSLPAGAQQRPSEYTNPAVSDQTDPAYWLDLGGLFATYGNYTAAVEAYHKALELNPNMHQAYFDLGVAYMEMGQLDQALEQINKAITLSPQEASYYYGRGRALLLAGQSDNAMADFRKAAEMGDADAKAYLKNR